MKKPKYVGVKLEGPDHHALGVISAKEGISKSAMLRLLVANLINSKIGDNPSVQRKGGNFRKGGTI